MLSALKAVTQTMTAVAAAMHTRQLPANTQCPQRTPMLYLRWSKSLEEQMSIAKNFQLRLKSKTSDTADEYSNSKSGKLQRPRSTRSGRRPTVMYPNDRAPFSSSTTKTTAAAQPSRDTFNRTQSAKQQIPTSVTHPLADCSHEVPDSLPAIIRPEEF